jgi:hypothetical protein
MAVDVSGPGETAAPRRPFGLSLPRALDLTERTLVVFAFIFFLGANVATGNGLSIGVALTDAVTVFCILLRRPADSVSLSPFDWAVAVTGSILPLLARPGGEPLTGPMLPSVLLGEGLALSIAAKLALNRRFGVAPANRGVQPNGVYSLIRHPMYAGYLLTNAAYLLLNPTLWNALLYAVVWTIQAARIHREERWLGRDPAYVAYAGVVRFRVLPFVF